MTEDTVEADGAPIIVVGTVFIVHSFSLSISRSSLFLQCNGADVEQSNGPDVKQSNGAGVDQSNNNDVELSNVLISLLISFPSSIHSEVEVTDKFCEVVALSADDFTLAGL